MLEIGVFWRCPPRFLTSTKESRPRPPSVSYIQCGNTITNTTTQLTYMSQEIAILSCPSPPARCPRRCRCGPITGTSKFQDQRAAREAVAVAEPDGTIWTGHAQSDSGQEYSKKIFHFGMPFPKSDFQNAKTEPTRTGPPNFRPTSQLDCHDAYRTIHMTECRESTNRMGVDGCQSLNALSLAVSLVLGPHTLTVPLANASVN